MSDDARIAGAPVSWGVIEVPDWGYQMPVDRVLREAAAVGLGAMEAGPEEFLPQDPDEVSSTLNRYGLGLVGGFVPTVLHDPDKREAELAFVQRRAEFFASAGADVLVLAASTGSEDYAEVVELDDSSWQELFKTLSSVEDICARHGLTVALHSHYGTVVERDDQLRRFLDGCDTGLCLDTGHLAIGGSGPVEVAEQAADRVKLVHLKDVDLSLARQLASREIGFKEAAQREAFRPLGQGGVDVARLVEVLEGAGYGGWYVLEQDSVVGEEPEEGEGPIVDVRKSLEFLKERLERVG